MGTNVMAVLGGQRALRTKPLTFGDWHRVITHGVPVRSADALKDSLAVSDVVLAALLGVSDKTLTRARQANANLDSTTSDRLFRVAKIVALARDVLEGESAAADWLKRPQFGLGGEKPVDLLTTAAGAQEVEQLLLRMEYGVYS
jgi:putative toxin-antitoxin system antitoxin component (TIGR02293 family)